MRTQSTQLCVPRATDCEYSEYPIRGPTQSAGCSLAREAEARRIAEEEARAKREESDRKVCADSTPTSTHSTPVSTHSTHCEYSDHPLLVLRVPTVSTNRRSGLSARKVTERQRPIRSVPAVLIHNGRSDPYRLFSSITAAPIRNGCSHPKRPIRSVTAVLIHNGRSDP